MSLELIQTLYYIWIRSGWVFIFRCMLSRLACIESNHFSFVWSDEDAIEIKTFHPLRLVIQSLRKCNNAEFEWEIKLLFSLIRFLFCLVWLKVPHSLTPICPRAKYLISRLSGHKPKFVVSMCKSIISIRSRLLCSVFYYKKKLKSYNNALNPSTAP